MTDFTDTCFKFWTEHPAFKEYVESGMLDFAVYDAYQTTDLKLHHSGVRVAQISD
jgi:hypothetical protein